MKIRYIKYWAFAAVLGMGTVLRGVKRNAIN